MDGVFISDVRSGRSFEEVAVSDKNSNFFQTQDKAAVIELSSCREDL